MRKFVFILGWLCLNAIGGYAQSLSFGEDFHNFGTLNKSSPNVEHTFQFRNTGDKPLQIEKVKTSCGCTSPKWPKEPVKPGEKGEIKVVFSPAGQSGFFQKNITVKTTNNKVHYLMIEGIVQDKEKAKARAKQTLPYKAGAMQFNTNQLTFGDVRNQSSDSAFLTVFNGAEYPLTIKKLEGSGAFSIANMPITFQPGEKRKIKVNYSTRGVHGAQQSYGTRKLDLILVTNDRTKQRKQIEARSRIYPHIKQPKADAKRPGVKLGQRVMNLGEVPSGYYLKTSVEITNTGNKPLRIFGTDAQMCSCTAPIPRNTKLAPGESTSLKINFNANNFNGRVHEALKIYTNDPEKPYTTLLIKAFVET